MAKRGGARPGAGRPKGPTGPHNEAAARVQARVINQRTGPSDLEAIHRKMDYWLGRVEVEIAKGEKADHAFIERAYDKVEEAAAKAIPFTARRLASIEHIPSRYDLSKLTDAELEQFTRLARRASTSDGDGSGVETTRH